jgi:hypothetical protein
MKKVLLGLLSIIMLGTAAQAQPISDNAVIPMAITVNSILRLNVVRGGNIEFVFNNYQDFITGLSGTTYSTDVTVTSSGNWDLSVLAATTEFFDQSNVAFSGIALNFVNFNLTNTGVNTLGVAGSDTEYHPDGGAASAEGSYSDLTNIAPLVPVLVGVSNQGAALDNAFTINWECGTANTAGAISTAGVTSGRYTTNILLSLISVP